MIYGKNKRSNVEQTEDGLKRKKTEYSSKKHNKHNLLMEIRNIFVVYIT